MRAELSGEQQQFAAVAEELAARLGPRTVADLPPAGDPGVGWSQLVATGILGVDLPAAVGGGGAGTLEVVLAAEAFGRHLVAAPLVAAAGAARALHLAGAPDHLAAALTGSSRPVLALAPSWSPAPHPADGETPDLPEAPDAAGADLVVALDGGTVVVGLAGTPTVTTDRSRQAVRVGTDRWQPVGSPLDATARADLEATVLLLLAADLVGAGAGALDEAVAHVGERHQFGVPVGSFQAVQHLAADAHVGLVAARALVRAAAWRLDHDDPVVAAVLARRAALVAAEAGLGAAEAAVQLLGGIGHTWEHLASVRLRRALVDRALAGGERAILRALAGAAPVPSPDGRAAPDGYDLRDDDVEGALRAELRAWLDANPPDEGRSGDDRVAAAHAWHRRLAEGGWVGVSMPTDAGGRGLLPTCEAIVNDELARAGCPPPPPVGHLATALARYGTPDQRATHLAGLLSGRTRWCQGFSEPGAGSDLAAISTRAAEDGDGWVVDGRKIWTSEAAWAQWCFLLCRTEPDAPRHAGLSVLLVPLDAPGVEVTPIVTAWGSAEFAEVAFDGVRVPADHLLGARGQGWEIAMALLAVERGPADVGWIARFRATAATLDLDDPAAIRAVAWLAALEATVAGTLTRRVLGTARTPEGSVDKLLMTRVDQDLRRVALDQAGPAAVLAPASTELEDYLWSRAAGTFGGTSQIQRTIVAERLLGLPRR